MEWMTFTALTLSINCIALAFLESWATKTVPLCSRTQDTTTPTSEIVPWISPASARPICTAHILLMRETCTAPFAPQWWTAYRNRPLYSGGWSSESQTCVRSRTSLPSQPSLVYTRLAAPRVRRSRPTNRDACWFFAHYGRRCRPLHDLTGKNDAQLLVAKLTESPSQRTQLPTTSVHSTCDVLTRRTHGT